MWRCDDGPGGDGSGRAGRDVVGAPFGVRVGSCVADRAGREIQGSREVLADPSWTGKLRWHDRNGFHRIGHRPDLAWLVDGQRVAIEVELVQKSIARLRAILELHAHWRAAGKSAGVIYVCADEPGCARIRKRAAEPVCTLAKAAASASNRSKPSRSPQSRLRLATASQRLPVLPIG
jgi:hypothetical protein